ncbi:MAG: class I SAM-dependent methyltransferase [Betaproteobacteria bacterium]|nr:class I SAM-dependent methyltransferase [Betaproteobacteria bacterium]
MRRDAHWRTSGALWSLRDEHARGVDARVSRLRARCAGVLGTNFVTRSVRDQSGASADTQTARIFEWRRGFNTIYLLDLGVKLGLFKALAEKPGSSASDLAAALGLHAPYVETWCRTCYGMEVLDAGTDGRYRLAPHMENILANPGHPRYLGGFVRLGTDFAAEDFRECLHAFKTGAVKPFQGRGEMFAKSVAESTWGLQVATAKKILPELPGLLPRLQAGGALLEVGCGTGNLLLQLAKNFPLAKCVGVDIDRDSLSVAREKIKGAGLEGRAQAREGTVASVTQAGSFDAVVMVEVLHEISPEIRPAVVIEAGAALRPGGWIVIVDETYPTTLEEMREPEFKFPLHTGFEELYWGNVLPTREEQERLLKDAGFRGEIHRSLIGEGFTVLTAQKS